MKRLLDVAVAAVAIPLLAPLAALIAVAIRLDSAGPVFFRQKRAGRAGVPFTIFKFRTMRDNSRTLRNRDGSTFTAKADPRLTRVGRFLRETSLDELPQFLNVLKGDMSLVGPRPDLLSQLDSYDSLFARKLLVRPGLTSLPAILGRNSLTWRERAELDSFYVAHRSFSLDLRIILRTALVVFSRSGIYSTRSGESGPIDALIAPQSRRQE